MLNIKIFFSSTLLLLINTVFANISVNELRPGDFLFQQIDCGDFCDAIHKVTTGYNGYDFAHMGIVTYANDEQQLMVLESMPTDGVTKTPLIDFLAAGDNVLVAQLQTEYLYLIAPALNEAENLVGLPYNDSFIYADEGYYCSELIYDMFKFANDRQPLFALQPMTFIDPDTGVYFPAWENYFNELNIAIPESSPGINPGGISRSDKLIILGWLEN